MTPTVPLGAFWFLYMSAIGMFFPFYALYLRENAGLSGTEIGVVYAVIPLVSLFAPTLWGRVADRSREHARVLTAALVGSAVGYAALGLAEGFPALLAGTALLSASGTAVIPLGVSVSLAALGAAGHERFGGVRVWGTVGYLLLVLAFPWLLGAVQRARGLEASPGGPSEPGLELMFVLAAALSLAAAAATRTIVERKEAAGGGARADWRGLLGHGPCLRMLGFAFLAYLCLQGPMNFFPAYVRSRGGGLDAVSHMWIVMLLPEIPLVALSGAGIRRFGARGLLAVGVGAGGLRWIVCALSDELFVIYPIQMLHGVVVAGLLIGGPLYLD
ncbi:MAG: MFS transporter, partial [Candidatus Binatia bacterium]